MMKQLHATCRIDKATKIPAIFYREGNALTCYAHIGQHSGAAYEYYRADTRPAKTEEERCACLWLVAQYAQIVGKYDDEQLVIRARLPKAAS